MIIAFYFGTQHEKAKTETTENISTNDIIIANDYLDNLIAFDIYSHPILYSN